MSRLIVIIGSLLCTWAGSGIPAACGEDRPPNIVLIVSDDQGYNDLGVLNPEVLTPHLDRLARAGVRLTDFHVAWPACTPSRGALLTGRYPQRNGILDMLRNESPDYGHKYSPAEYAVTFERIGGMDVREVLLPGYLAPVGYRSAIFGKWDLGIHRRYLPLQRGFDEFLGFVNTGIDYFTHERYGVPSMYRDNSPTDMDKGTYCTFLFRREAERFIDENRDRPFFLYLPFNAPHNASSLDPAVRSAAQAPDEHKRRFPHLADELREVEQDGKTVRVAAPSKRRLEYLASIACMDDAIGGVLDKLDEHRLADRTIVLFFSDNGGSGGADNSPLRGRKSQMYEGGIRVCALIRGPGLPQGTVCDEFLTTLDVLPTLLAITGAKPIPGVTLDGFDVRPTLQGKQPSPRREMFWKRRDHEAARVGDWKWIRLAGKVSLFQLREDLEERHDLARARPDKAAELERRFAAWTAEMEASEPREPFRDY